MSKKAIISILAFTILGCNVSVTPQPVPINYDETASRATQIAILTTTTQTVTPPASAVEPFNNLETQVLFRDDFDRQLKSDWVWINEKTENWSLESKLGFLEINAINGYFNLANASNILLYDAPQNNFIIETSFIFDPDASDQFAGLIALDSNQNFIQAGIGYCSTSVGCVGRGLYVDVYENGNLILPRNNTQYVDNSLFIRLMFKDGFVSLFISQDKFSWFRMFEKEIQFNISRVGLIAAQNNDIEPIRASFDYFEISLINP